MKYPLIVITALLALTMLIAGCSPAANPVDEQKAAEAALVKFYEGHIPDDPYTPQGDVKWDESGLVSQALTKTIQEWNYNSEVFNAEPFLCAQANPTGWKISNVTVDGERAEGTLDMMFGETPYPIQVYLVKEDGQWKIDSTECFPVKP